MKKLFFNCQFTGLHQKTTLISMGIVSEDGDVFYAEFTDYDKSQVDDWIQSNVIDKCLVMKEEGVIQTSRILHVKSDTDTIKRHLDRWLDKFEKVEMYGDHVAYGWVLFCNLFGDALNLPKNICYIPVDICTIFKLKGIDPDGDRLDYIYPDIMDFSMLFKPLSFLARNRTRHNAFYNAHVTKACYEKLVAGTVTK